MRKSIHIALMMISTGVFAADEGKNQTNVYDDFRGFMKPSADVTVDEQVTAIIKGTWETCFTRWTCRR